MSTAKLPQPIDSIVYTVEDKDSTKESTSDLHVEDPPVEEAIAILTGPLPREQRLNQVGDTHEPSNN